MESNTGGFKDRGDRMGVMSVTLCHGSGVDVDNAAVMEAQ